MFNLIPSGGSITTFKAFWRIPNGKSSVGLEVNQSQKFELILIVLWRFSSIFSN